MATLTSEIQSLSPSAKIELYELDATALGDTSKLYFHAGTNQLRQPVVWKGISYLPFPIEAEGFDITTSGSLPRPKLRVANLGGEMSAEVRAFDDLVGAKVTRRRTFARFLDAVNFTGGVNVEADPNQGFPDDVWFVERKVSEDRFVIEWELASAFDLQGVLLPNRQVIQNTCWWKYRDADCGYTGTAYFDANDAATNQAGDYCAKRLSSCKARFGTGTIRFGGYPGARRYG